MILAFDFYDNTPYVEYPHFLPYKNVFHNDKLMWDLFGVIPECMPFVPLSIEMQFQAHYSISNLEELSLSKQERLKQSFQMGHSSHTIPVKMGFLPQLPLKFYLSKSISTLIKGYTPFSKVGVDINIWNVDYFRKLPEKELKSKPIWKELVAEMQQPYWNTKRETITIEYSPELEEPDDEIYPALDLLTPTKHYPNGLIEYLYQLWKESPSDRLY